MKEYVVKSEYIKSDEEKAELFRNRKVKVQGEWRHRTEEEVQGDLDKRARKIGEAVRTGGWLYTIASGSDGMCVFIEEDSLRHNGTLYSSKEEAREAGEQAKVRWESTSNE